MARNKDHPSTLTIDFDKDKKKCRCCGEFVDGNDNKPYIVERDANILCLMCLRYEKGVLITFLHEHLFC